MSELGVDPGKHGAWALLDSKGGLIAADHFPLGTDGEISTPVLYRAWLTAVRDVPPWDVVRATVERVGSMGATKDGRKQGIQGMFNFGRRYGAVLSLLDVIGVARDDAEPSTWKRACGVTSDKGTSLALARRIWPSHAETTFRRVKDEARAEAALIARYGMSRRSHSRRAA